MPRRAPRGPAARRSNLRRRLSRRPGPSSRPYSAARTAPPSKDRACPWMYEAAGDANHATALPYSSTVPMRPSGMSPVMRAVSSATDVWLRLARSVISCSTRSVPAAFEHVRHNGVTQVDAAHDCQLDRSLPVSGAEGQEATRRRTAGIQHDDVQVAQLFDGRGHHPVDVLLARDVTAHGEHRRSGGFSYPL